VLGQGAWWDDHEGSGLPKLSCPDVSQKQIEGLRGP
jgi:hypothetical protein